MPLLNSQRQAGGKQATLVSCRGVSQGMKCAQELASGSAGVGA